VYCVVVWFLKLYYTLHRIKSKNTFVCYFIITIIAITLFHYILHFAYQSVNFMIGETCMLNLIKIKGYVKNMWAFSWLISHGLSQ